MSTFHSTSTADGSDSSSRSSQFGLDEHDMGEILVYRPRCGLATESQHDLANAVNKDCTLRVSKKPIPRGNSRIEVKTEDLYNEPERSAYAKYPNMQNSLASIALPRSVYWKRLLLNRHKDIYIVSPESSPNSSANNSVDNSPENSQHVTPSHTFPPEDETHS